MKKSQRLLATLISLASIGIFVFLSGFMLASAKNSPKISYNQSSAYKYLFLKLTSKPQDLIAQEKPNAKVIEKKQQLEKKVELDDIAKPAPAESKTQNDSIVVNEKNDSTNCIIDEKWFQQIIQINGCLDYCTDFVEKEWMKDHNFIIL